MIKTDFRQQFNDIREILLLNGKDTERYLQCIDIIRIKRYMNTTEADILYD